MGESSMMPWEEASQGTTDLMPWDEAKSTPSQPQEPSSLFKTVTDAAANMPLGMVSRGANALNQGFSKISNAFPLSVPQSVQQGAQSLFRGSKALGVGMATQANPLNTSQDVTPRVLAANQPNYQPKSLLEKAGSTVGENLPVIGASLASPNIGGPLSLMAQQAQAGKVSPVPLAMGLASKVSGYAGSKVQDVGQAMEETGQKMATGVADILPNTVSRLANKFSENGNPSEAGANIGQKLINDGVLEGNSIGEIFNKVQSKADEAGKSVGDAIKQITDESAKYGTVENPQQIEASQILKPLQDQAAQLASGRLSGTRAMGTPINQMLKSLQDTAEENGGWLSFDDIEGARKEAGQLWSKTPQGSPKFAQYSQLYGTLADIRNNMVDEIANNAQNPQLATDLQKANSEYHFYDSVLNDVTKGAARAGVGKEGLASAVSSKMGMLGALYALARGDVKRAVALGMGGKLIPLLEDELGGAVAKEAVKTGSFLKNKGSLFQNIPKATVQSTTFSNTIPSNIEMPEELGRKFWQQAKSEGLRKAKDIRQRAEELAQQAGY